MEYLHTWKGKSGVFFLSTIQEEDLRLECWRGGSWVDVASVNHWCMALWMWVHLCVLGVEGRLRMRLRVWTMYVEGELYPCMSEWASEPRCREPQNGERHLRCWAPSTHIPTGDHLPSGGTLHSGGCITHGQIIPLLDCSSYRSSFLRFR